MFNTKSKFHKGSSVLVSALVTAAASTLIGYGLTKMISTGIDAIKNQEVKMQGQQYAASRINVLRSVRFDSLSPMAKRQINDTDYYEEVVESDNTADRKNYAVNIYKGSDSVKPVAVMNLSRTATGALLDNQGADSYDSLGAGGNADSSALNTSALKNYTNDKFSADSESFATDRAMDVKSFVSYVDGLLSKYRFRNNAVTVGPNGAGTRQNPIYVSASDFECVPGSVTYAMTGNSHGYLATLTPAGNGLYYVDYIEKDVPDETTGGGTGGGSTGGSTVAPPVGKFDGCKWESYWEWSSGEESTFVDIIDDEYYKFVTCSNTKYIAIIAGGNLEDADDTGRCSVGLFNSSFESLDIINGESGSGLGYGLDARVLVEVSPNTTYYASYSCSADCLGITDCYLTVFEVDPTTVTINSDGKTAQIKSLQDAGLVQYEYIRFYKFL